MGIGEGALGHRFFIGMVGLSGGANGMHYVRQEKMHEKSSG